MIQVDELRFRYPGSDFQLAIENLDIQAGEKVAIVGPSGSGKTTLLNLIAGISHADSGSIKVDGDPISKLNDAQRRNFRIAKIGMVFQQFELVEYLNAIDNILLPFQINSSLELTSEIREQALELGKAVGMDGKLRRKPAKLSQGEQQRIAICRALINRPELILADEPTGNLDPKNKELILQILFDQVQSNGQTLVCVTHDMSILNGFDRTIDFENFRVSNAISATDSADGDPA